MSLVICPEGAQACSRGQSKAAPPEWGKTPVCKPRGAAAASLGSQPLGVSAVLGQHPHDAPGDRRNLQPRSFMQRATKSVVSSTKPIAGLSQPIALPPTNSARATGHSQLPEGQLSAHPALAV